MLGKPSASSDGERLTVDNLWKILSDKNAAPRDLVASAGHHSGSNDGSRNRQQGSSVERQQRLQQQQ